MYERDTRLVTHLSRAASYDELQTTRSLRAQRRAANRRDQTQIHQRLAARSPQRMRANA